MNQIERKKETFVNSREMPRGNLFLIYAYILNWDFRGKKIPHTKRTTKQPNEKKKTNQNTDLQTQDKTANKPSS